MAKNRQLITQSLLTWFKHHGRTDLPWQNTHSAYRIWVSEIMLQQTQVATVIPYYQRFMQRFPAITDLANAEQDEVLHLWTGLGYYARARNLHKTAQIITQDYNGEFPTEFAHVLALPGIGRSTAGAVLAFSQGQHLAILDGNVKRVLARFYNIEGWYGHKPVEQALWELAELNTPDKQIEQYTQAIMDFGATLCTRSKPQCQNCPLQTNCQAYKTDRVGELPHGKPKTIKPVKHTYMLMIENNQQQYLLTQNPPTGIWGGLWCPPQTNELHETINLGNLAITPDKTLATFRHTFSHYHLDITPVTAQAVTNDNAIGESKNQVWYNPHSPTKLGLAAPVKKLLEQLAQTNIRN